MFRQRAISLRISFLNSPYMVAGCSARICAIFQPPGIVNSARFTGEVGAESSARRIRAEDCAGPLVNPA